MLSVNNLTKKYGDFTVFSDVNLDFDTGLYALLAPNGAGKTTLIKILTTLAMPTRGEVLWDGTPITSLGESYRDLVGYLPQDFGYYKNYSPRQYLRYLAALKGLHNPDARINELLDMMSLSSVTNKKMKTFSGGMLQRVGVAQALLNDPKILILDEPTSGLDPKERVHLRNIIAGLAKDRIIIISTHIVSDIETIAQSLVMLKNHRVMYAGPPNCVIDKMADKIFELPRGTLLPPEAIYLSERVTEQGAMVRFALDTPQGIGQPVTPGLEDAFLYFYNDSDEIG